MSKLNKCTVCGNPLPHHFMSNKITKYFALVKGSTKIAAVYCSAACAEPDIAKRRAIRAEIAEKEARSAVRGREY